MLPYTILEGVSARENLYADDYYTFERGSARYHSSFPTTWTGTLALMYPSDYAYAADLSKCTKDGSSYSEDTTNCTGTDLMYELSTWSWTLTPYAGARYLVYNTISGIIAPYWDDSGGTSKDLGVYPVGYLKSTVQISSGSGTSSDPYELSLS